MPVHRPYTLTPITAFAAWATRVQDTLDPQRSTLSRRVPLPLVPPTALQAHANADPEFRLAARYWQVTLSTESPTHARRIAIEDGQVTACDATVPGQPATITVVAPEAGWAAFLAPMPRPFYQDLLGGCIQYHRFTVAGDLLSLAAY